MITLLISTLFECINGSKTFFFYPLREKKKYTNNVTALKKGKWAERSGSGLITNNFQRGHIFSTETSSLAARLKVRNNDRERMTREHNAAIVEATKAAAEPQG